MERPFSGQTIRARRIRHCIDDISTHSTHTHSHYILTNTHTEQRKFLNIIHSNTYVSIKCQLTPRTTPLKPGLHYKNQNYIRPLYKPNQKKVLIRSAHLIPTQHNAQNIGSKNPLTNDRDKSFPNHGNCQLNTAKRQYLPQIAKHQWSLTNQINVHDKDTRKSKEIQVQGTARPYLTRPRRVPKIIIALHKQPVCPHRDTTRCYSYTKEAHGAPSTHKTSCDVNTARSKTRFLTQH